MRVAKEIDSRDARLLAEIEEIEKKMGALSTQIRRLREIVAHRPSPRDDFFEALTRFAFKRSPDSYLMSAEVCGFLDAKLSKLAPESLAEGAPRDFAIIHHAATRLGWTPGSYKSKFSRDFRQWLKAQPGVEFVQYSANDRRFYGIGKVFWECLPTEIRLALITASAAVLSNPAYGEPVNVKEVYQINL